MYVCMSLSVSFSFSLSLSLSLSLFVSTQGKHTKGGIDIILSLLKKPKHIMYYVHKIEDAHLQCVDNHYAKFENKGMKTV